MKRAFVIFALVMMVYRPALAAPQTLEGVVSESMCGKKHMLPGKSDAQCTKECIKANSKYTLVVGEKLYTLSGPISDFEKHAGQRVRITGDVKGNAIVVNSVAETAPR